MFKNLYKRFKSDRGDAILTMSIILIPLFCLCAGFAIDLTKASYVKQSYINISQEAGKESIKQIDIRGNLTPQAPVAFVSQYMARFTNESQGGEGYNPRGACTQVEIAPGVKKNAPYMEISLYAGRGDKFITSPKARYISEGGAVPTASMAKGTGAPANEIVQPWDSFNTYKVISVRVWDTVPNAMMGWFGLPCQKIVTDTNSVTFGTAEDETNFTDDTLPECLNTSFDGSSKITWSKPVNQITSYTVTLKGSSGSTTSTLPATATSYINAALGTNRQALINANYQGGSLPSCQGYQGTIGDDPATCVNPWTLGSPVRNADGTYTFAVSWTPRAAGTQPAGNKFQLYYSKGSAFGYSPLVTEAAGSISYTVPASAGLTYGDTVNISLILDNSLVSPRVFTSCNSKTATLPAAPAPTSTCVTSLTGTQTSSKVGTTITYNANYTWAAGPGSPVYYYSWTSTAYNPTAGRFVTTDGSGQTTVTNFSKSFGTDARGSVDLKVWYGSSTAPSGCGFVHVGGTAGGV